MNNNSENLLDVEIPNVTYAKFWSRVGASMIDGFIVSPIILPLTYYDMIDWKSPIIYVLISIFGMAYKPVMEYYFGATIGKKAVKLKVVNYQHEKANLSEILMRNMITLFIGVISLFFSVSLFSMPGFEDVNNFMDYSVFVNKNQGASQKINMIMGSYYIIDVIFLWTDEKKRTLHDRIGKTYVIKVAEKNVG